MWSLSLIYHEIMSKSDIRSDGDKKLYDAKYTFDVADFGVHLNILSKELVSREYNILNCLDTSYTRNDFPFFITFDDGKIGSFKYVVDMLDYHGIKGYFFIITDRIGHPEYMDNKQIYQLYERGHFIGTHTCSHPSRMWSLSREELLYEWGNSKQILSSIIGEEVKVAAVPGGFYSKSVAEAASEVGIKALFTSEPTMNSHIINGCTIIGRYSIEKSLSTKDIESIVRAQVFPRYKQRVLWETKKTLKRLLGNHYASIANIRQHL